MRQPFYALAPMAGFTDSAFRQICRRFGADAVYSEMVSAAALFYNDRKTVELMKFDPMERPYVVQLFGNDPRHFAAAVEFIENNIKPDGIDINFGCPVPKVARQGAGIALFSDLKRSREVVKAAVENTGLPVSVKARSRVKETDVLRFLDNINDLDVKAVMIHGRGASAGYAGPVDAEAIKKARGHFGGWLIANGGVKDYISAQELLNRTGADGLGIGQGALGRPWIFKAVRTGQSVERGSRPVFKAAREHAALAYELKGEAGIVAMRKHLARYVQGLPGARELRNKLVKAEGLGEVERILRC